MRVVRAAAFASVLASGVALADPPRPTPAAASPRAPGRTARAQAPNAGRYRSYVAKWHAATPDATAPLDEHGRAKLVLYSLNSRGRTELAAASDRGGFAASDLERAASVLRETASGNEHPVEPRLLDVVYRIQRHFQAEEIRVISGYRTPPSIARRASNHGRGRAIDIVVPGASDADVAKYAREMGFVGVGIYPSSGFVHVDVRDRSYFWIDASGPGKRNRERGILGDLAARSDASARARGEHGLAPFAIGEDVDAALSRPHSHAEGSATSDEDDEEDESQALPADE
jgi:uncharacterized protein YcbK (DUF882 family)